MIVYDDCGLKVSVPFHTKDLEAGIHLQAGDKVLTSEQQQMFLSVLSSSKQAFPLSPCPHALVSGGVFHQ